MVRPAASPGKSFHDRVETRVSFVNAVLGRLDSLSDEVLAENVDAIFQNYQRLLKDASDQQVLGDESVQDDFDRLDVNIEFLKEAIKRRKIGVWYWPGKKATFKEIWSKLNKIHTIWQEAKRTGSYQEKTEVSARWGESIRAGLQKFVPSGALRAAQKPAAMELYRGFKEKEIKRGREKQLAIMNAELDRMADTGEPEKVQVLMEKIAELKLKMAKGHELEVVGKKTREAMQNIGATHMEVIPGDGLATLDAMFFDACEFRDRLDREGARYLNLGFGVQGEAGTSIRLEGLVVDQSFPDSSVGKGLSALGAFGPTLDESGAGWVNVKMAGDQTLILTDEKLGEMVDEGVVTVLVDGSLELADGIEIRDEDLQKLDLTQRANGTVLLTSGNAGVYEMHKREILAFLFRGLNVFTFNFRGYGLSEGFPSTKGLISDVRAAYEALQNKTGDSDETVLVKPLCLSGGPASCLADEHPEANFFFDQTYHDFRDVAAEQTKDLVSNLLEGWDASTKWMKRYIPNLAATMARQVSPNWAPKKNIEKIRGHVALLQTTGDTLMKEDRELFQNIEALAKRENGHVYKMEGEHGDAWVRQREVTGGVSYSPANKVKREVIEKYWRPENLIISPTPMNEVYNLALDFVAKFDEPEVEVRDLLKVYNELEWKIEPHISDISAKFFIESAMRKLFPAGADEGKRNQALQFALLAFPTVNRFEGAFLQWKAIMDSHPKKGDIPKLLTQVINNWFREEQQAEGRRFLEKHVRIPDVHQNIFGKKKFMGRVHMDNFLRLAHLGNPKLFKAKERQGPGI